jgi:hypothetical protein
MVVGFTIFAMDGNPYYSPQFPRGGLAGTFTVQVTHIAGSPTLQVEVEHRNTEDTGWTQAGAFKNITSTTMATKDITGLKEILRFKFSFGASPMTSDGVHVFVPAPSWRPY